MPSSRYERLMTQTRLGEPTGVLSQAIAYWNANKVDNPANPQLVINQTPNSPLGNLRFGSSSGVDANDPLWLGYTDTKYAYTPGSAGNTISCPSQAATELTGDLDIRCLAAADWNPPSNRGLYSKSAAQGYGLHIAVGGFLRLSVIIGSTFYGYNSTESLGLNSFDLKWVRITRIASTGIVQFFTSDDGVTWTQLGVNIAGVSGAMNTSAATIRIGSTGEDTAHIAAKFYYGEIRSSVDGTVVNRFDGTQCFQSGYTDSINSTVWTVNRSTTGVRTAIVDRPVALLGTDDFFELLGSQFTNEQINFDFSDSFTVVAGIRLPVATTTFGTIYAKRIVGNNAPGFSIYHRNNNTISFRISNVSATNDFSSTTIASVQLQANVFSHFYSPGSSQNQGYIDGIGTFSSTPNTTSTAQNTQAFRIGCNSDGTEFAHFEFMALAIFREKLTTTQIQNVRAGMGL